MAEQKLNEKQIKCLKVAAKEPPGYAATTLWWDEDTLQSLCDMEFIKRYGIVMEITPSGRAALTESAPATEPTRDDLIAALQKAAEILDEVACFIGTDDETPADLSRRLGGGKRFEVELDVLADILARCK